MDKLSEIAYLLDFYGGLLTQKQRDIMSYHYEEDMSLSEICELYSISRQAVHDIIKRSEKILFDYEIELGLVKRHLNINERLKVVKELLAAYNENSNKEAIEIIDELIEVK
jgi:predicted DNA-binding protein YlxM (UPF0122 family)